MDSKEKAMLILDRRNGMSYRTLAKKYGVSVGTAHHLVMPRKKSKKEQEPLNLPPYKPDALPDNIDELKEALRQAQLKIELLNNVITIASKELGVDIRKKSGTRRS